MIFLFQIATGWREYTIEKETFKTFPLSSEGRRKKKKKKKICKVIAITFSTRDSKTPQNARSNKSQNPSSGSGNCHDKIRMDRLRGTRPDGSLRGRQGSTQGCHADPGTEGQLRGSPGSESSGYPESQANVQGRMCPALGRPRATLGSRLVRHFAVIYSLIKFYHKIQ